MLKTIIKSKFTILCLAFAAAFIAVGLSGIVFGASSLGIVTVLFGALYIAAAVAAAALRKRFPRTARLAAQIVTVVSLLMLGVVLVCSVLIASKYATADELPQNTVVVVLGAGLDKETGTTPGLLLRRRLDAAADFLEAHPRVKCIVSGGQGPNENVSEAIAMGDWLIRERGIEKARIIYEAAASNTRENIKFSREMAYANNLRFDEVIIVTDGFHQYRAQQIAARYGATAYSLSSDAPSGLTAIYWLREVAGIVGNLWLRL
ncbi:MAG: YdcF family protein [Oscillospiraceae bacterium]|jgi:vancomycin permeability regulator SanA|nr:YdcF family protein [Oscillospiraceae bacterium]